MNGTGSFSSSEVGLKSVNIGSLTSGHPNYLLSGASLEVVKRPLSLFGSRIAGENSSLLVQASELSLVTVAGETLVISGTGSINDNSPGTNQPITLGTLAFSSGSGSASNYTFSGGTFFLKINLTIKLITNTKINKILFK